MSSNGAKVIAVVGPTCAGKSDLALFLAQNVGGEIINGDSMQVYRGFDIGSAKPTPLEQREVPHHLIDVADPNEESHAALFQQNADEAIRLVWSHDGVPIVVGGTGLYHRVLFHGLFPVKSDVGLRESLRARFRDNAQETYDELKSLDPHYAASVSPHDVTRVVRGLEIIHLSGVPMSEWQKQHGFQEERYDVVKIGLTAERADLYRRIDDRVDHMLAQGWVGEVKGLLAAGWSPELKPFKGIGYREILLFLQGKLDYASMVSAIKTSTRHYAKRQVTWFSKEKDIDWHEYPADQYAILDRVRRFLG